MAPWPASIMKGWPQPFHDKAALKRGPPTGAKIHMQSLGALAQTHDYKQWRAAIHTSRPSGHEAPQPCRVTELEQAGPAAPTSNIIARIRMISKETIRPT